MSSSVYSKLYKLERADEVGQAVRDTAREARSALIDADRRVGEVLDVFGEHWPSVGQDADADLAGMVRELFALKGSIHEALCDARLELAVRRAGDES